MLAGATRSNNRHRRHVRGRCIHANRLIDAYKVLSNNDDGGVKLTSHQNDVSDLGTCGGTGEK